VRPGARYDTQPSTSTTTSVGTRAWTHTSPPVSGVARTALATVWPAVKFRLEATGAGGPHGKTVTKPAAPGLVTVTLSATPRAPSGARVCTDRSVDRPPTPPVPSRVSTTRYGVTAVNPWVSVPSTSTMT